MAIKWYAVLNMLKCHPFKYNSFIWSQTHRAVRLENNNLGFCLAKSTGTLNNCMYGKNAGELNTK